MVSRARKLVRRLLPRSVVGWLDALESAPVCSQGDLARLPPLDRDIAPLSVREMRMHDPADIAAWLEVHNDAFASAWGVADYEREILRHPTVAVWHTYLIMDGDRAIGAASAGVYRRNPEVGVGHFVGLRRAVHGRGLGRHLVLYRYHRLREAGIGLCESETTLRNHESLGIHFDCGFRPKLRLDAWNSPDPGDALQRWITRLRLRRFYRRWSRERSRSPASPASHG